MIPRRRLRTIALALLALVALLPVPSLAQAQAPAAGHYVRTDGKLTHRLELRADGSASATTQTADGSTMVATRFQWRMDGDRLLQSRVRLQDRSGQFTATRDDVLLELRNVSASGFESRARTDLPWFSWRRQDAKQQKRKS